MIKNANTILKLADLKKSVEVLQGKIWKRMPATFVANWQFRILVNLINNNKVREYIKKK